MLRRIWTWQGRGGCSLEKTA